MYLVRVPAWRPRRPSWIESRKSSGRDFSTLKAVLYVLLVGLFIGRSYGFHTTASQFVRTNWSIQSGLPQGSINAIAQGPNGYLWLGTFGGLVRFDGKYFRVYDAANTPELSCNRILSLHWDQRGVLWIGLEEDGLCQMSTDGFVSFDDPQLKGAHVFSIAESHEGIIWLATSVGLFQFQTNSTLKKIDLDESLGNTARTVRVDAKGRVWVGMDLGLVRIDNSEIRSWTSNDGLPGSSVHALHVGSESTVWIGTDAGLAKFANEQLTTVYRHDPKLGLTTSVFEDSDKYLWVAGIFNRQRGLFRVDLGHSESKEFSEPELQVLFGEASSKFSVTSLFQDSERNLWVGADGVGLARLVPVPPVTLVKPSKGIPRDGFFCVHLDQAGRLWAAGARSSLLRFDDLANDNWKEFSSFENVNEVGVIYSNSAATWVGHGSTLTKLGELDSEFGQKQGLVCEEISAICSDHNDRLLVGTDRGLFRREKRSFVPVNSFAGKAKIRSIVKCREDGVWIATDVGIGLHYSDSKSELIVEREHLNDATVRFMYEDDEGILWIGTYGAGLFRYFSESLTHYTTADGLADNTVSSILEDKFNRLWMNGNRGVSYSSKASLDAFALGHQKSISCRLLGAKHGVPEGNGGSQSAGSVLPDGRLCFPNVVGLSILAPADFPATTSSAPLVQLEEVSVNQTHIQNEDVLRIFRNDRDVVCRYSGIFLSGIEPLRFRYRLSGLDEKWSEATSNRSVVFRDLPPGDYCFEVRASSDGQTWSKKTAKIQFSFKPTFWESLWFRCLLFSAFVMLAISCHFLRMRIVHARNQREQEEQLERERLQNALKHSRRLESLGRLVGGISHDFNNILCAILNYLSLLRHELPDSPNSLSRIVDKIDTCGNHAADLGRQLMAFGRSHPNEPDSFDLNQVIFELEPMVSRLFREDVSLTVHGQERPMWIRMKRSQIEQVVMNLLLNAHDAILDGGEVHVRISSTVVDERFQFEHSSIEPGAFAVLEVTDNGIGMDEVTVSRIFEPFFTTKPMGSGTGLGLASVHDVITNNGGAITVKSKEGKGTSFILYIPRLTDLEDRPVAPTATLPKNCSFDAPPTIVVCEDFKPGLDAYCRNLRSTGFNVLPAHNAKEAMRFAEFYDGSIQFLVTDVVLPDDNGSELAQKFCEIRKSTKVLFISGHSQSLISRFELGDRNVLLKPFETPDLVERILNLNQLGSQN